MTGHKQGPRGRRVREIRLGRRVSGRPEDRSLNPVAQVVPLVEIRKCPSCPLSWDALGKSIALSVNIQDWAFYTHKKPCVQFKLFNNRIYIGDSHAYES